MLEKMMSPDEVKLVKEQLENRTKLGKRLVEDSKKEGETHK